MVTAFFDIPAGRFGAEIDAEEEGDDRKEGRTNLEPPSDPPSAVQRQICAETEEDTKGDPHLPTHDETTANRSGDVFSGKDGDRGRFGTHTEAEQQTADEKLLPGLTETRTDDREKAKDSTEEDSTTTSKVEVEWIGEPATATEKTSRKEWLGGELCGTHHKEAEM